jgi:serine/threonine protein phosphatase 1
VLAQLLVIDSLRSTSMQSIFLKGNHEQMLLNFMLAPSKHGDLWFRNGGTATLASYGVFVPVKPSAKQLNYVRDEFAERMPVAHLHFLENLPSSYSVGDYFFCHAGINPEVSLDKQTDEALLWTRRQLQVSDGAQEKIIVHGHVPVASPVIENFHINVDTGAFATGCLTALKLQSASRSFISIRLGGQ